MSISFLLYGVDYKSYNVVYSHISEINNQSKANPKVNQPKKSS